MKTHLENEITSPEDLTSRANSITQLLQGQTVQRVFKTAINLFESFDKVYSTLITEIVQEEKVELFSILNSLFLADFKLQKELINPNSNISITHLLEIFTYLFDQPTQRAWFNLIPEISMASGLLNDEDAKLARELVRSYIERINSFDVERLLEKGYLEELMAQLRNDISGKISSINESIGEKILVVDFASQFDEKMIILLKKFFFNNKDKINLSQRLELSTNLNLLVMLERFSANNDREIFELIYTLISFNSKVKIFCLNF